jgi:hypothetical protein
MGTPEGIEFTGWIQNPKRNYWNTKSINEKKNSKKNCVSYLKSGKRPKICPDGICRPDPNPKKNYKNIKSTNQNEIFPKKNMFSTLKVYRSKKFVWGLPDGICGLDPKS